MFRMLDPQSTHIGFVNELPDQFGGFSAVDYLYYYNGAGVACGDINNDGLTDIFFVANHGKNKLYLNKGNLQFDDISTEAGIEGYSDWKTGVSMADVNADGHLDIYVCAVGDYKGLEGSNELYINNGDNSFTERSADYGLDYTGFASQAAFFDYDRDGDLDMYLATHARFTSRSMSKVIAENLLKNEADDYLFRNDDGRFTDVSESAGIRKALRSYGLGIAIADFNNDGWDDVYVTNDFYEGDYYFLNNQDGTFTESLKKYFGHVSLFSRGCDAADMNNDGYQDLMTVDISNSDPIAEKKSFHTYAWDKHRSKLSLGYPEQFSRNTLQLNQSGTQFSDVALLSCVDATDHSWSTLLADYNNDGHKDIFITNGTPRFLNDLDYLAFAGVDSMHYAPQVSDAKINEALQLMPAEKTKNRFYQGTGNLAFVDKSSFVGMDEDVANGASYADLDNDGDIDLITNRINDPAAVYENRSTQTAKTNYLRVRLKSTSKNTFGIGAKVIIKTGEAYQVQQLQTTRGFLSSVEPVIHFGLGNINSVDSLIVIWGDGKRQALQNLKTNQSLALNHEDAKESNITMGLYKKQTQWFLDSTEKFIDYKHRENKYAEYYREKLIPFLVSAEGPKLAIGDVNQDGREDFYAGGAKYQAGTLFIQNEKGGFTLSLQEDFKKDSIYEDVDGAFLDVDNDGDLDLYVVSGGNEFYDKMNKQFDRLYRNNGKGNFTRDNNALPEMFTNKSCVRPFDFDKDGDLDLFVGSRVVAYHYGQSPPSYLLVNDGRGNFKDMTANYCPDLLTGGMITDAVWKDTDNDNDIDLVVVGDWMAMTIYENTETAFKRNENIMDASSSIKNVNGFWQCLIAEDFDGDKDIDFITGNLGLNTKFRKHGDESRVILYHGDFDVDGKNDHLIATQEKEGSISPFTKDEFESQFESLKGMFKTNAEFAEKSMDELISLFKLKPSDPLVANQFASLYFENIGGNKFIVRQLPQAAQTSKVFSMYADDFDADGQLDVLIGGNYTGASIYQGNYDASTGALLRGDGKGNFESVATALSGAMIQGEVRDIKCIKTTQGKLYLVTKNNGPIQILKINKTKTSLLSNR